MDKYTSLLCWSQRVTWIFGSALDTAHQNSILRIQKSSLRYFILQKCSIPSLPVAVLCGIEPQQLEVIGVSLFTS